MSYTKNKILKLAKKDIQTVYSYKVIIALFFIYKSGYIDSK